MQCFLKKFNLSVGLAIASLHPLVSAFSLWAVFVAVDFFLNDDPAVKIAMDVPATHALLVPPLLDPRIEDGLAHYQLDLGTSSHDFHQANRTSTIAYNQESLLGPTLRLHHGDRVVIDVTNHLDEDTTTHWHGADLPAEADGGAHSVIRPGETWQAKFDVIQEAATLWYHPHYQVPHGRASLSGSRWSDDY